MRADGTLKDADEIEFYNDPSDDLPLPPSTAPAVSSSGNLNSFITAKGSGPRVTPAIVVGGSRHSRRTARPSAKVRESASSSSTVPAKRQGGPSAAKAPVQKQARIESDEEEVPGLCEVSDEEDDNDNEETDDERMRLMGDTDRIVSVCIYLAFILLTKISGS